MSENEHRQQQRVDVATLALDNALILTTNREDYVVSNICDVSPFGAGVIASIEVEEGEILSLRLSNSQHNMTVTGSVIWCKSAGGNSDNTFRIGILFAPENMAQNLEFFQAITNIQHQ